jgi:hypothetical protein
MSGYSGGSPGRLHCAPYLNRVDELALFQGTMIRAERDLETRSDRNMFQGRETFAEEEMA